jgi:DNA polymerase III sliding clamp (beta) subunit (PCNA family)
MAAEITVENASFADVIKKANSVAAAKGEAFDKAAGIVIQHDPEVGTRIRATNLELFYTEWIDAIDAPNEKVAWRVSSRFISAIAGGLPIGSGKTVTLSSEPTDGMVALRSGRITSMLPKLNVNSYPEWGVFDPDALTPCNGFGHAIDKVEWAAARDGGVPLSGIHFTGEMVIATNRYLLGAMPLELAAPEPFTVPGSVMAQLVKSNDTSGTTLVALDPATKKLFVMPNQHSQIQVVTYAVPFPNIEPIFARRGESTLRVGKQDLLSLLQRTESLSNIDRNPKMNVWVGKDQIAAQSLLENHDGAMLGDVIECEGAPHKRSQYSFTPANLINAVQNAPGNEVEISYKVNDPSGFWCVASDGGYQGWVVPRKRGDGEG